MDPDVTPEPEKTKASFKIPLTVFKNLLTPLKNLATVFKNLLAPFKNLATLFKNLPIPKKLVIPAIAGAVLLIAGGAAFGLLHARLKHPVAPQVKVVAAASVASTSVASTSVASASVASATAASGTAASATAPSAACSGVVRDIYRQTVDEDPDVTLAEVRSEVLNSGISCVPVPEIAAQLKDLSAACRDMVQYTFLGVRDGHPDIKVSDIREKVVLKSVACEHDRAPNIASSTRR